MLKSHLPVQHAPPQQFSYTHLSVSLSVTRECLRKKNVCALTQHKTKAFSETDAWAESLKWHFVELFIKLLLGLKRVQNKQPLWF